MNYDFRADLTKKKLRKKKNFLSKVVLLRYNSTLFQNKIQTRRNIKDIPGKGHVTQNVVHFVDCRIKRIKSDILR